jgi:hypothetical protein
MVHKLLHSCPNFSIMAFFERQILCYFSKTKPEVVDAFRLAMTSINTGTRHTGLIAFLVYNNPAVDATTNAIECAGENY